MHGAMQTVVETAGFLGDARSLGLSDGERLGIVTWIAANPAAGEIIEGTAAPAWCGSPERAREKVAAAASSHLAEIVKTYRSGRESK